MQCTYNPSANAITLKQIFNMAGGRGGVKDQSDNNTERQVKNISIGKSLFVQNHPNMHS